MRINYHSLLFILLFVTCSLASSAQNLVAISEIDNETKVKRWGFSDRFYTEAIIKCQYDSTMAFTEGFGRVKMNGKYGFVDKTGKLVIPAKYDGAMEFKDGFAAVFNDGKAFFIDKNGIDVFKKTFKSISSFSFGLAMCAGEDGRRGFIDTKGNIVVPLTLEAAFPFGDKLTPVRFNGEKIWKAINTKGEVVFTFNEKVKFVTGSFSDGMAMVYVDGPAGYNVHYDFVNENGEFVCDAPYASAKPFKDGRAIITYENKNRKSGDLQYFKYGLIKKGGREIVPAKYACLEESPLAGIYFYGNTSASIRNCNGYGLLDSSGKELTRPVYSNFTRLNDTTFLCKEADKGLVNRHLILTVNGKNLLSLNLEKYYFSIAGSDTLLMMYSQTFDGSIWSVYNIQKGLLKEKAFNGITLYKKQRLLLIQDWQYTNGALMTTGGKMIAEKIQTHIPYPDGVSLDKANLLLMKKSGEQDFRLYNLNTGKYIAGDFGFKKEGGYFYNNNFSEGLLAARQKNKWGYIDSTGKFKIPALYESVNDFIEGWAVVEKGTNGNSNMVYINKAGKEMSGIKAAYLNASNFIEGFAHYKKDGFSETIRYIDKTGKEIFKTESDKYFDHGDFSNGLAAVPNKEGNYGYINTKGELVIPYQFSIPKTQYTSVISIAFSQFGYATVMKDGKTITINKLGK